MLDVLSATSLKRVLLIWLHHQVGVNRTRIQNLMNIFWIVRGRKQIEIEGETLTLKVSESFLVRKGARVRLCCLPMNRSSVPVCVRESSQNLPLLETEENIYCIHY